LPTADYLDSVLIDMEYDLPNRPRIVKNRRVNNKDNETEYYDMSSDNDSEAGDPFDDNENDERNDNRGDEQDPGYANPPIFDLLNEFSRRIPVWGGTIEYNGVSNVRVTNTCTIDYFLLALWLIRKLQGNFAQRLPGIEKSQLLNQIVGYIENRNWNKAKEIYINRILEINLISYRNTVSLFGSEKRMFLNNMTEFQSHSIIQLCTEGCIFNNARVLRAGESEIYLIKTPAGRIEVYSIVEGKCESCAALIRSKVRFENNPSFLFFETAYNNIYVQELPRHINIDNIDYRFLCATVSRPGHFIGLFEINNNLYKVNDLISEYEPQLQLLPPYNQNNVRPRRGRNNVYYYYENVTTTVAVYYAQ
jgi:hypothetical protein